MTYKIAVLEIYPSLNKANIKSKIDAHLRNSQRVAEILNCDLLLDESDYIRAMNTVYDCFILGYASHYAPHRTIRKLLGNSPNAKKIILSNEYNMCPSLGGFAPYHLITNYENLISCGKSVAGHSFVDLNILLVNFDGVSSKPVAKKYDCIYYGTFRPNRSIYFKEYLRGGMYLSTSKRNMKKFQHVGCTPKYVEKLYWGNGNEVLRRFKYSLYIEDTNTHNNYNCLANRFFEAVMCDTVLFFDVNCKNTVIKSGIALDDIFYVIGYDDLMAKISANSYTDLIKRQKSFVDYSIKEKAENEKKLKDIIFAIIGG